MDVKDFGRAFLDEYVLYVCNEKITIIVLVWNFQEPYCRMYYAKLEKEYVWLEYELGNTYEYVMHNVRNYKNALMKKFSMHIVLYTF